MVAGSKWAKGDAVTVKGRGNTRHTILHITPNATGAVLVSSGEGEDYATTYVNADDLKAATIPSRRGE